MKSRPKSSFCDRMATGLPEHRLQLSTVQHVASGLHERRRAPRTGEDRQLPTRRRQRLLGEWDAKLPVVRHAERLQRLVPLVDVRVAGGREIAAVDGGSPDSVPDALVAREVGIQQLALLGRRQLGERLRGGVGERTADAEDRLRSLRGVHEDADLRLERLAHRLERQLGRGRQPVVGVGGGGVDRHLPRCDSLVLWRRRRNGARLQRRERQTTLSKGQRRSGRCRKSAAIDATIKIGRAHV